MGSRFKKSLPPLRGTRARDAKQHRHESTMDQLLSNMYDTTLDESHEGSFDAVCLSGIKNEQVNNLDPFAVHERNQKYEIVFRPLIAPGQKAPAIIGETDPKEILRKIQMHRNLKFIATSDDATNGESPFPQFGQIVKVKCGNGNFKRGNCTDYIYESISAGEARVLTEYKNLKTVNGIAGAINTFKNSKKVVRMGGTPASVGLEVADAGSQIPGSVMPIADPSNSIISSGFGTRKPPTAGASKDHSGVDYTSPTYDGEGKERYGMNIIAIFPGKVTRAGAQGGTYTQNENIGRQVGSGGYGLRVEVRSEVQYGDGTPVTIICNYGHLYDIAPGAEAGQYVQQGDVIGPMGTRGSSTGVHLHFDVRVGGKYVDPVFLFNWQNETKWLHDWQKERFYNEHPELRE